MNSLDNSIDMEELDMKSYKVRGAICIMFPMFRL